MRKILKSRRGVCFTLALSLYCVSFSACRMRNCWPVAAEMAVAVATANGLICDAVRARISRPPSFVRCGTSIVITQIIWFAWDHLFGCCCCTFIAVVSYSNRDLPRYCEHFGRNSIYLALANRRRNSSDKIDRLIEPLWIGFNLYPIMMTRHTEHSETESLRSMMTCLLLFPTITPSKSCDADIKCHQSVIKSHEWQRKRAGCERVCELWHRDIETRPYLIMCLFCLCLPQRQHQHV